MCLQILTRFQNIKSYKYPRSGYTVVFWGYTDRQTNIYGEAEMCHIKSFVNQLSISNRTEDYFISWCSTFEILQLNYAAKLRRQNARRHLLCTCTLTSFTLCKIRTVIWWLLSVICNLMHGMYQSFIATNSETHSLFVFDGSYLPQYHYILHTVKKRNTHDLMSW